MNMRQHRRRQTAKSRANMGRVWTVKRVKHPDYTLVITARGLKTKSPA